MARVALVGDSHAQVMWPLLASLLRAGGHEVVLSVARPGWSEARYLTDGDLTANLRAASPDVVVFCLGGNNRQFKSAAYTATLRALLATARPARVVWIGPSVAVKAPFDRYHADTATLQVLALGSGGGSGVTWIDSRPFTARGQRADGVHFLSYRTWVEGIAPAVLAAVAGAPLPAALIVRGAQRLTPTGQRLALVLGAIAFAGLLLARKHRNRVATGSDSI